MKASFERPTGCLSDMKTYKPKDGDEITFRLTVRNKATMETREYTFTENLKLPYEIEKY